MARRTSGRVSKVRYTDRDTAGPAETRKATEAQPPERLPRRVAPPAHAPPGTRSDPVPQAPGGTAPGQEVEPAGRPPEGGPEVREQDSDPVRLAQELEGKAGMFVPPEKISPLPDNIEITDELLAKLRLPNEYDWISGPNPYHILGEEAAKERAAQRRRPGPKTPEGKAAVRQNAFKHGLLSREIFVSGEDPADFLEMTRDLRASLAPEGAVEDLLVERIIGATWRLRRAYAAESDLFKDRLTWHSWRGAPASYDAQSKVRPEVLISPDFEKILRYETTVERSLFRSLHELQRLQAKRRGERVDAPVAGEVDVNLKLGR